MSENRIESFSLNYRINYKDLKKIVEREWDKIDNEIYNCFPQVTMYIDVYKIIRTILGKHMMLPVYEPHEETLIKESEKVAIAVAVLNIVAHYMHFFRKKMKIDRPHFVLYSAVNDSYTSFKDILNIINKTVQLVPRVSFIPRIGQMDVNIMHSRSQIISELSSLGNSYCIARDIPNLNILFSEYAPDLQIMSSSPNDSFILLRPIKHRNKDLGIDASDFASTYMKYILDIDAGFKGYSKEIDFDDENFNSSKYGQIYSEISMKTSIYFKDLKAIIPLLMIIYGKTNLCSGVKKVTRFNKIKRYKIIKTCIEDFQREAVYNNTDRKLLYRRILESFEVDEIEILDILNNKLALFHYKENSNIKKLVSELKEIWADTLKLQNVEFINEDPMFRNADSTLLKIEWLLGQ